MPNLKPLRPFSPFASARERISIKTHSTESRFVTGPSNVLFAGAYVSTFQPGNVSSWGSEGVSSGANCNGKLIFKLWDAFIHVYKVPFECPLALRLCCQAVMIQGLPLTSKPQRLVHYKQAAKASPLQASRRRFDWVQGGFRTMFRWVCDRWFRAEL